jgi:hypothetical protein
MKMPKEQKLNVLISHSWMDKLHAEKLSKALDGLCNIWMDYRKLRPGDQIQKVIDQQLNDIDLMLVGARPEIGKNGITGHQKNKIPLAATLD